MATLVEKGDGGVNLSELTDGELSLLGMLKMKYRFSGDSICDTYLWVGKHSLSSMSNISEVTINIEQGYESNLPNSAVHLFGNMLNTAGNHTVSSFTTNQIRFVKTGRSSGESEIEFTITSFTTKDGKVHTLDNLNY